MKYIKNISIILVIILSITIIYSSFNEKLIIDGMAYIRVDEDIRVTNVTLSSVTNNAYETYNVEYSKDSISSYVTLPNIDSTVTYNIEVTNKSDYYYALSNIDSSLSSSNITYTIDYEVGSLLSNTSKSYITVTFKYADSVTTLPSDISYEAILTFKFGIKVDFTIDGESVDTTFPTADDGYTTAEVSCDNDVTALFDAGNWNITNVSIDDDTSSTCTINFTSSSASFDYTGSERVITILVSDIYKLETWGANYYDYVVGGVSLNKGDILYLNIGGVEDDTTSAYNNSITSVASVSGLYSTLNESDLYVASNSNGTSYVSSSLSNGSIFCYNCSVTGVLTTLDSSTSIISRFSSKNNGYIKLTSISDVNVAKIGDVEYKTLQAAFDAVSSNTETTVTLINDSTWSATVDSDKNIVLDLSSYDAEGVINNGTFTLEEGTYTTDNFSIYNNGTLSIGDGVNITTNTRTLVSNYAGGTFTISGTAEFSSLSSNFILMSNYGELNITGGTLTALNINVIDNFSSGEFTMTGGSIVGDVKYAIVNSGTSTLSGGSITNQSTDSKNLISNRSGATMNISDSIVITSLSSGYMAITNYGELNMSGGTITALSTYCLQNYSGGTFTMTGGALVGDTTYIIYNKAGTINLKGGSLTNQTTTSGCILYNASGAIINISGTAELTTLSSKKIGINNSGEINMTGGTITGLVTTTFQNNSTGTFLMTGGTIIGDTGYATFYNKGTSTLSGGTIKSNSTDAGSVLNNYTGGTLNITDTMEIISTSSLYAGFINTGTLNLLGGTLTALSNVVMKNNSGGVFNMTGGSIVGSTSYGLYNNAGTSTLSGGSITTGDAYAVNNTGTSSSTATLTINGTITITNNSSTYSTIYNGSYSSIDTSDISNVTIKNNNSSGTTGL